MKGESTEPRPDRVLANAPWWPKFLVLLSLFSLPVSNVAITSTSHYHIVAIKYEEDLLSRLNLCLGRSILDPSNDNN